MSKLSDALVAIPDRSATQAQIVDALALVAGNKEGVFLVYEESAAVRTEEHRIPGQSEDLILQRPPIIGITEIILDDITLNPASYSAGSDRVIFDGNGQLGTSGLIYLVRVTYTFTSRKEISWHGANPGGGGPPMCLCVRLEQNTSALELRESEVDDWTEDQHTACSAILTDLLT